MDMNDLCRLCLSEIVQNSVTLSTNPEMFYKIKECVSIEITEEDCYTKSVCETCLNKVNGWFEFKEMCLISAQVLKKRLKYGLETTDCSNLTNVSKICDEGSIPDLENDNYNQDKIQACYKCDFCDKNFVYYMDYLDHQDKHEGQPIFNCVKCQVVFSSKKQLIYHEKSHKIPCKHCGLELHQQSMRAHLNKHSEKFKCLVCLQCFNSRAMLNDHMASIHTKMKNHVCEVCAKVFSTKSSLSMHLKTHKDNKDYKCGKCQYATRTSAALYIHMSTHSNEVHICEYCSKIFKSNRNLSDHLKRVHCKIKRHHCTYCNKTFAMRYQLETHVRIHTGVHPYHCGNCPKTFARSDNLKEHMNTHQRSIFFNCCTCSKTFLTRRGLKKHKCKDSSG
ncbi:zinc finger protein 271-like isoform X2 [Cylas formicarius]|uniref:zinc finger protein 271-like isoform X2 n=1 Tax=Cylas formicarius TaxID=197179 RepID=UPI002958DA66|nr:zinc finger protein 271-like isoform X2 [Cylas formicarius]